GKAADKPEGEAAEDGAEKGAEDEGGAGKKAVDPRKQALAEKARQLRIERQTEITSTLPTEGALFSSLRIPKGLVGDRGLRYGRFVVLPSIFFGTAYTDNAEAADQDREEDLSLAAAATVRVQPLLARHQFGVNATATASHSFQEDNDDFVDWQVGADGRLDLTRRSGVFGRVDYGLNTEDDSSADAEGQANDLESINGNVGYDFRGNRFDYLIDFAAVRSDFSGGGSADRDNTTYQVNQRLSHRTTPRLTLFVTPQYTYSLFDEDVADDGEGRDAQTITGLVGADVALRAPITLSAAAGYTRLLFDDSGRDDSDSVVANGTLGWQISPLSSLELSASHSLELTTVDGAAARTSTALALGLTRQVGLDTSLRGEVGSTYSDFRGIDRNDVDLRAGVGVAHRLSDHFFLSLAYQYERRLSDQDDTDFYSNEGLVGFSVIY
ncbi:MAG: outer membrane beta-barrel protein, partial [Geminicoccaceae bacterium]